jgi:lipoprotein-anchoring transpeptidase ErfK/SrfK
MADLAINQLPSASIATANNVLPIVQGGVTDQITVTNLGAGIFNLGNIPLTASVLTVGNVTDTPSSENTLNVYPAPAGGVGEGGQILLAASGGAYTSASMVDTWQNTFRLLKGTNTGGSTAAHMIVDLQSSNTLFAGAVTASAYSGLPNDYLYATRSGSAQTVGSAWANTDIIFNNVAVSKGISFNTSTGVASLTGGKVYRVTARLAWGAAAAYNLQFSCFTSANTQIGPTTEIIQASNGTSNISDGTLEFIYAPGSNTDIKIRCTNNNTALSGETVRADLNTQFIIQQIA